MARKANWRALRIHRSYTVNEAARTLCVGKPTVRRWIKAGLPIIDDQKPMMILGRDLLGYLKARKKPKKSCNLDQCFCFKCCEPRMGAYQEAEIVSIVPSSANIRMLCERCATIMHKRMSWTQIEALTEILTVSASQALKHLIEAAQPCLNVHYEEGA